MITMHRRLERCRSRLRERQALTVTELLLVVALIGILSAVSISNSLELWRRERLNGVALELEGWLEGISRMPERNGTSCEVTISSGTLAGGQTLATVSPTSCAANATLVVPVILRSDNLSVGASATSWSFTPRMAIDSSSDVHIRLAFSGSAPVRCVRVSATLGLLRIGRNDSSSSTAVDCPSTQFDRI